MPSICEQTSPAVAHGRTGISVAELLAPLHRFERAGGARPAGGREPALRVEIGHRFTAAGRTYEIPRIRFSGPEAGHDPIRLALFAGLHGDEPAGGAALVKLAIGLAAEPLRGRGYELHLYPVVNPTGLERGTRENHAGADLNREFWRQSGHPEVRYIESELRAHAFAGLVTLHADDTSPGVYGYAHGRTLNEALLAPALHAASRYLPLDQREVIDGFPARAGLICQCFGGVLSAPPDQRPKPFDVIMETPAHAEFDLQVQAAVAALDSILHTYPGFIAYAQDI